MERAYDKLIEQVKITTILGSTESILSWDQETMMSPGEAPRRALQLGAIAQVSHQLFTTPEIGMLIKKINIKELSSDEQANFREIKKSYQRAIKVPKELIKELSEHTSKSLEVWAKAKETKNYSLFLPMLKKTIELKKQYAKAIDSEKDIYQVLLEDYEDGLTLNEIRIFLEEIKQTVIPLVRTGSTIEMNDTINQDIQQKFLELLTAKIGYDYNRGRLDISGHPFTSGTRITTNYTSGWLFALTAAIHESGHGMYEQGLPQEAFGTPLGESRSLSIHESQSRIWENNIGKSKAFWDYWFPIMKKTYKLPYSQEDLLNTLNSTKPSFIRVDADELTYNLHVILRFEIEQEILHESINLKDAPRMWNEKMQSYLGITPSNDAEGILQDIHWSWGLFGYFPTYIIGSIVSAQLYAAAKRDMPDIEEQFRKGKFENMHNWLKEKVHSQGQRYTTKELVKFATGKELSTKDYIVYLQEKFKR